MKSVRYQTDVMHYVDEWQYVSKRVSENIRKTTWEKTALFVHDTYSFPHMAMKSTMKEMVWKTISSL